MNNEPRIVGRLLWNLLRRDWLCAGLVGYAILAGMLSYWERAEKTFLPFFDIIPVFFAMTLLFRERDSDRVRAMIALPIPPRVLATTWWAIGNLAIPAIYLPSMFLMWSIDVSIPGHDLVSPASVALRIAQVLWGSSVLYAAILLWWLLVAAGRALNQRPLEWLGNAFIFAGYFLIFWMSSVMARWGGIRPWLLALAPVLAAANWKGSIILLPSRSFLRLKPLARRPVESRQTVHPRANQGLGRLTPVVDLFKMTLLFGLVTGLVLIVVALIFVPRDDPRQKSAFVSAMMPQMFFFPFLLLAFVYQWLPTLRALRVLPWRRSVLALAFGGIALSVALASGVVVAGMQIATGFAGFAFDPHVVLALVFLLTGVLWLFMALMSLIGPYWGISLAMFALFMMLVAFRDMDPLAATYGVPLGLIFSLAAWLLLDQRLLSSRTYRLRPLGKHAMMN